MTNLERSTSNSTDINPTLENRKKCKKIKSVKLIQFLKSCKTWFLGACEICPSTAPAWASKRPGQPTFCCPKVHRKRVLTPHDGDVNSYHHLSPHSLCLVICLSLPKPMIGQIIMGYQARSQESTIECSEKKRTFFSVPFPHKIFARLWGVDWPAYPTTRLAWRG